MIGKAPQILVPIVGEGRIEEVDHPYTNMQAGSAGTRKTMIKAAGAGALFMILLLLVLAALDRTVRGSADVEDTLGLTMLGVLPRDGAAAGPVLPLPGRTENRAEPERKTAPIVPGRVETEAVRALRTRTAFLLEKKQAGNVLMITDAEAGGQGEDLAAALAISFARAGRRVLLIDTDMRNGALYKKLGIPDEIAANGLSGWLRGEDEAAADALAALKGIQLESGLFPAATVDNLSTGFGLFDGSPWEYGTAPHIAPTAWFVMAVNGFNPYAFDR